MTVEQAEALLHERHIPEALHAFGRAEAAGADPNRCAAGRWLCATLQGDFETAWQQSDSIRSRVAHDPNRFWQGEDFTGKRVILRCLHGLGDAVQFLRYAPLLKARASTVIVQVPPRLLELAPCFDGVDEVVTWSELSGTPEPAWDVQMEIVELPYIFRTQSTDLPIASEYLHLPAAIEPIQPRNPSSMQVGVVWAGGSWSPSRSVPPALLDPVFEAPVCEFWNLQGSDERASGESLFDPHHNDIRYTDGVLRLARTIAQLDLVITTDTLAAHLAGALGKPAWVMLEHAADWRWMLTRDNSPWYPTLRLFRQTQPGDWPGVIARIRTELDRAANIKP